MQKLCSIIGAGALLFISATHSFAIEGLQISVVNSNAVLTWPSTNDGSETFLVQYRSNLVSGAWTTLADFLPASPSNTTTFMDVSNLVQMPAVVGGGGGGDGGGNIIPQAMAEPANSSGAAVPLAIYPPGFDFSSYVISDPSTGLWESGSRYAANHPLTVNRAQSGGGVQPMDETGADTNQYTGFYRVVRDGAYLYATNGTVWSGVITVPVELGNAFGTAGTMSLTEDGDMVGDSIQPADTSLTVDTTQMSNGVHQVSVSTSWSDTNGNYVEADSAPVTVNVYNEISFPNWVANYGELDNLALFQAVSAHTNADWNIDVYGSDYAYIGSFSGHTDDGNIQVVWNLVDPYGNVRTNDTFFICVFTTYYDDGLTGTNTVQPMGQQEAQIVSPETHKLTDPWIGHGGFVSVEQHAWDTSIGSDLLYQELEGFTGAAQSAGWNVSPPPTDGGVPYGLAFGDSNPQGDTDWAKFRAALYNPISRNLIYFGHGGVNGLGYNPAHTNRYITAAEVGAMLHNLPAGQTNAHHYRFCFVDGCSTAKGAMPEAFGIPHKENVPGDYYGAAGLRYSAYVGWKGKKIIGLGLNGGEGEINTEHVNFIVFIQDGMLLHNYSIKRAMEYAADQPGISSFHEDSMTVYGYWDLKFGTQN